jgi:hypothetical protein
MQFSITTQHQHGQLMHMGGVLVLGELKCEDVHRLENILTLTADTQGLFVSFDLWLEAVVIHICFL